MIDAAEIEVNTPAVLPCRGHREVQTVPDLVEIQPWLLGVHGAEDAGHRERRIEALDRRQGVFVLAGGGLPVAIEAHLAALYGWCQGVDVSEPEKAEEHDKSE